jgi:protein-serine/threonine kinase
MSSSPAPQHGMTIPPAGGASAPMSRNPSSNGQPPSSHLANLTMSSGRTPDPNVHAPTPVRKASGRSNSGKPTMLGAVGEKKSFFQKMFHHEPKEKHHIDLPKQPTSDSILQNRDATSSPPVTPGTPPPGFSDSDHSQPPSRRPSTSSKKHITPSHSPDPHASGPKDRRSSPPAGARLTERSASHGSTKSTNGDVLAPPPAQPVIVGPTTTTGGNKFTLKDLLGGGGGPKLGRRSSAAGSAKGSDKGSTKGSERGDDNASTASLLKKYGVCEKVAIGKGATAVVRLAHKWDRSQEKLYAVKVRALCIPRHTDIGRNSGSAASRSRRKTTSRS